MKNLLTFCVFFLFISGVAFAQDQAEKQIPPKAIAQKFECRAA